VWVNQYSRDAGASIAVEGPFTVMVMGSEVRELARWRISRTERTSTQKI